MVELPHQVNRQDNNFKGHEGVTLSIDTRGQLKYDDFRDLKVWRRCEEIRIEVWELCRQFPAEEKYRLSDQMIRSSRSACALIAEGYGRYHYQENIQFCRQARGSLYENAQRAHSPQLAAGLASESQ